MEFDVQRLKISIKQMRKSMSSSAENNIIFKEINKGYRGACNDILKLIAELEKTPDQRDAFSENAYIKFIESRNHEIKIEYKKIKFLIDELYAYYLRDIEWYEQDFIGLKKEREIIYEKSEALNQLDDLLKKRIIQIVLDEEDSK